MCIILNIILYEWRSLPVYTLCNYDYKIIKNKLVNIKRTVITKKCVKQYTISKDESSDVEQHPPFGDRNTCTASNEGGGEKTILNDKSLTKSL